MLQGIRRSLLIACNQREPMRKLITIASLAVLAVAIAFPFANAAVSYDDARVGHVDKGDVQSLFGWNDSKMQQNAAKVTFANKQSDTLAVSWMCTNGKTHSGKPLRHDHPPARRRDRDEQGRQGHRLER